MEDFNGPLDLILHLLSKNKMEIKDIQISLILDQYLAWMDQRKRLDLEVASEFVTMAAQLVFIKTRMLLSIHDEEALSEMEQLIASLEEHQRHESFARVKAVIPEKANMRPALAFSTPAMELEIMSIMPMARSPATMVEAATINTTT